MSKTLLRRQNKPLRQPRVHRRIPEIARFFSGGDKLLAYDKAVSGGPKHTSEGLQLQRAPLVETRYRAVRRTAPIQPPDEFFLRSKAGS